MSEKYRNVQKLFSKFIPKRLKKLNRSVVLAGVLTFVLVVTSVAALAFSKEPKNDEQTQEEIAEIETAPAIQASVTRVEGTVEYKSADDWEKIATDHQIMTASSLRTTGAGSRAEIAFEDGSIVRIDANSEVKFETLTSARIVINHISGYTYNRVTPSEDRTYIVHTEHAQFQSLGTAFRTIASGDEEAVEVYQSRVNETSTNTHAEEGQKLTIKNFGNPEKDEKVDKLDIEILKKDSFIVWNRDLDSQNEQFKGSLGFLSDFDGPAVTISDPIDGATIQVSADASQGSIEIGGSTEKGTKLTVQSKSQSGSSPIEVAVDDSGNFRTQSIDAPLGRSVFEFVATDKVGNKSTTNVSFVFEKKASVQQAKITLNHKYDSNKEEISFGWILDGMTTPDGVKIIYSKSKNPSFPGDELAGYEKTKSSFTFSTKKLKSGETYYFRVCRYTMGTDSCDVYSNQVSVEIE